MKGCIIMAMPQKNVIELQKDLEFWEEDLERTIDQRDMESYAFALHMCTYIQDCIKAASSTEQS